MIDVRVPAGIKDGQKVRVRGKGQPGAAGYGDLVVSVAVQPHAFYTRDGDNLRIHVPVTAFFDARNPEKWLVDLGSYDDRVTVSGDVGFWSAP